MKLTVISDPSTGLLMESDEVYNLGDWAYRERPEEFRPLRDATRARRTPDGCTVGENAALLTPGEYVEWNGALTTVSEGGGPK